jgi:hypothetical protein
LKLLGFGRVELEGEVDALDHKEEDGDEGEDGGEGEVKVLLPLLPLDNKEEDGDKGEDGDRLPPSLTSSEGEFHDQVDNAKN